MALLQELFKSTLCLFTLTVIGCSTVPVNVDLHKINAWSTQDSVIITSKMSQLIDTRGELAFVMAHELGHIMLLHHARDSKPGDEMAADRFAFQAMEIAGHSPCYGISAMRKITKARDVSGTGFSERLVYWSQEFAVCPPPSKEVP